MADQPMLCLSPEEAAHLDAWSTVYVEADIRAKLGIPLSQFLWNPGRYLTLAWLATPA
ncbi:hypothetical protein N0036_08585 [Pseudomonas aeruginosa]|uniref:hypothetical protein n=1 Tax=Pseudomonas aeruginosa TaxID=287 RepID=UPI000A81AA5C|nr:hypothetical protein [Pseudomonas aeruginosa]MCS7675693.1 hypothetical protein [Pseudomonas aeruginosa]MCS7905000.1 hypothetical protein [Pseudomonas aeruginosa]MCS9345763.1 hypothetical protein [Pseudomonas aeruginosa]MCS9358602.1 hypothetical protein [Pseudomonas aeruginosa]MCS9405853.1 hypothetical protein [Pseudomonas aeruginosa]